ncbi:MAG: MFS transporter, partial [Microbacterium sp.]
LALAGIVLFAFSLRSAVASLSPVVDHISADFALPAAVVGLIGTIPPLCYAGFGIVTPLLERRFGLEALAAAAMVVAAIGLGARGRVSDGVGLLVTTALTFAAVGVGNVLLPPLVKRHFPDRIGLMTAVYTATMAASTFLPPLVAVPVADAVGWRVSLSSWAGFALVAAVPWFVLVMRERPVPTDVERVEPRALRRMPGLPMTWALTAGFVVSSTFAYTTFAWLPAILVDVAGVLPATAGGLLSLSAMVGLPSALLVPLLVVRWHAVRAVFVVSIAAGLVGVGGLLVAPAFAPWLWAAGLGLTCAIFPLTLVLVSVRSRTPEGAVALSGFVQSVGYGITAAFPLGIGLLHDATGSWTGPLLVLAVVVLAAVPALFVASRPHTVEDEWERRHGAW